MRLAERPHTDKWITIEAIRTEIGCLQFAGSLAWLHFAIDSGKLAGRAVVRVSSLVGPS